MSEPARSFPPTESGGRPAPGPLRDWLAAMKAHGSAQAEPALREPAQPARSAEAGWSPRVVTAGEAPPAQAEDSDVSELMAENLMLKAKLRLEEERQGDLQAQLAEQIRDLRRHIAEEVGSLDDLRAEQAEIRVERETFRADRERLRADQDALRADRDKAISERDGLRAERDALAAERDILREERDLWRARTETLAQPLFQIPRR